ncbi:MAG TPA: alanine--tRNA ligase, partial [Limnochordia bacterium]
EAIEWAWEFVTCVLGFSQEVLWVTIYQDDDEAFRLWNEGIGVASDRIVRLGRKDNFWEIGVGPCGPCSEIHVDRGPAFGCGKPDCKPGCDCQRYLEIWNLVFIQFRQDEAGRLHPLEQRGIDTGMGLERTAALLQGVRSIFETDLVCPILEGVAAQGGIRYGADPAKDVSLRVITDHMRGVTFLVLDGVRPSNEGRGYVLRRLLRRAVRHARLLGIEKPFLAEVGRLVANQMAAGYPEVEARFSEIEPVIAAEELRFRETLDQGMAMFEELSRALSAADRRQIPGEDAFRLHDTYGFPIELLTEIAREAGLSVDLEGFEREMASQRARARAARRAEGYLGADAERYTALAHHASRFVGYDDLQAEGKIIGLLREGEPAVSAKAGDRVDLVLDVTPFYAEGGGQVGDRGTLRTPTGEVEVQDAQRIGESAIVHVGRVRAGEVAIGQSVVCAVDRAGREAAQRHHTGTHLLHRALHEVVGRHARQAGSLVAPDRLRFDFTHAKPLDADELARIEREVNAHIIANLPVTAEEMDYDAAIASGAMALFGEKYGDRVRVVSVGDYSRELCGGTHVRHSGELGLFKIVSETGVAAGVRRIEAVAGLAALAHIGEEEAWLHGMAERLGVPARDVPAQLEKLQAQLRELSRTVEALRGQLASSKADTLVDQAETFGDVRVVVAALDAHDIGEARL